VSASTLIRNKVLSNAYNFVQWLPFTQKLLGSNVLPRTEVEPVEDDLSSLFPACKRTNKDNLEAPEFSRQPNPADLLAYQHLRADVHSWVDGELDLQRLADIHSWLWVVGRPMPPRPLHQQRLLGREIVITERSDLHLLWTNNRMFIKPLPRFLLIVAFWEEYLRCQAQSCSAVNSCGCDVRRKRAIGFLFSYTALIMHESDFHIARDAHLLPEEAEWPAWRRFVRELLSVSPIYAQIDPRFHYGELRLSRINKIYFLWKTPLRGYMSHWNQYGSFLHDHFALLASSTVYIAVVLTAMQVGLATEGLQNNKAFQSASYGFTVFSIIGPLVVTGMVILALCYMFINNWIATLRYSEERKNIFDSR
jgi:hypothetical protein